MSMGWNLLLPRELTLAICEELDLNDLKHMRLSCKSLSNDVAPTVLSHIVISAKEAITIEQLISDLRFLTNPERAAVHCSSEITFGDLSSIFPDSNIDEDDVKRLSEEFYSVFTSFKVAQTVNWQTAKNDPFWLQEIIWKAIGVFPDLRHLRMNSFFLKQPIGNFDALNALESIKIDGQPFIHNGALFLSLSKLYASSFSLDSITIEEPEEYDTEFYGAHSLQNLLSSSPRENPAHRLRRLALRNVPIHLDEVSLSHLTRLTSFKLSSDDEGINNPPADIWLAFKRSEIRLEELEVEYNGMAGSLVDYLSSFSGLKKLKLSIPAFDSQAFSEASAIEFWSKGLTNHVDTLQGFSLRACFDDQWCFGRHNRSLIEKCTKLKQLKMSLLPQDIPTNVEDFNGINALIDTVVTHLPHVKELEMVVPSRKAYRGHRCGTPSVMARSRDRYRLADWVPKYQPPAHCQSLPRLTVKCPRSLRVFVGIKNARRSRWRYFDYKSEEHQ